MFDSLEPPQDEPASRRLALLMYGAYSLLGLSGIVIGFWRHKLLYILPSSIMTLAAAAWFIIGRSEAVTQRKLGWRLMFLFILIMVPTFVDLFRR